MPTQAERRAGTRRALLDATVACLVTRGYAGASTTAICSTAGVSQGALFKHFPTKGALLAAAAADVFPRVIDRVASHGAALPPGEDRPAAVVDLLFEAYTWPELQAAVELYVAARSDTDLAAALAEVEPPHRARLHGLAAALLPERAAHPLFAASVDLAIDAVQGFSMGRRHVLGPDAADAADRLATALRSALDVLAPAEAPA
jgi:AcrR family transcriptional regulator